MGWNQRRYEVEGGKGLYGGQKNRNDFYKSTYSFRIRRKV